jgi:hypothetical protein
VCVQMFFGGGDGGGSSSEAAGVAAARRPLRAARAALVGGNASCGPAPSPCADRPHHAVDPRCRPLCCCWADACPQLAGPCLTVPPAPAQPPSPRIWLPPDFVKTRVTPPPQHTHTHTTLVNGFGLALVIPCVSSMIADYHPPETRGNAFGMMGLTGWGGRAGGQPAAGVGGDGGVQLWRGESCARRWCVCVWRQSWLQSGVGRIQGGQGSSWPACQVSTGQPLMTAIRGGGWPWSCGCRCRHGTPVPS